ncbi:uncharacterized protein LOC109704461, partial [Ananas comosus]|uniref:Uncharacterized protein LOC109704461 n=1 Tax=Ananas comosus TaxID=4615 RepID=A0A6P5EGU5_ANACO
MVSLASSPPLPSSSRLRLRCCEDTLGLRRRRPPLSAAAVAAELQLLERSAAALSAAAAAMAPAPPRPRRIVLVRHGQSEGNVDEAAYARVPDPRIGLTAQGWRDADECGRRIRRLVESGGAGDDWRVYFYVSPYRRTLETLCGIGRSFEPLRIAGIREEPRLREQDFGNFQDREKMRVEKETRLSEVVVFFKPFSQMENRLLTYIDQITGGTSWTGSSSRVEIIFRIWWNVGYANREWRQLQPLLVHHTVEELRAFVSLKKCYKIKML